MGVERGPGEGDRTEEEEVVLYLENTPSMEELRTILQYLGMSARELLRKGEQAYKDLALANTELSEDDLIAAMCKAPKLIERPIVIKGKKAVLGRPPENVKALF